MTKALYHLGLLIDVLLVLFSCGNALLMYGALGGGGGMPVSPMAGLTAFGAVAVWAIPVALSAVVLTARRLRARGATGAATVLLWVPAFPIGLTMLLWGGLAAAFILFGR